MMSRTMNDIQADIVACDNLDDAFHLMAEVLQHGQANMLARKAEAAAKKVRHLAPDQPELAKQAYQLILEGMGL